MGKFTGTNSHVRLLIHLGKNHVGIFGKPAVTVNQLLPTHLFATEISATKKKLTMKYWLFNWDPYNGLL